VARDVLPFHHDVEIARVMASALAALTFLPPLRLQVNNRKLIEGFYRGVGVPDPGAVMRVVDKLDKVPADVVAKMLADDAGLSGEQVRQCMALAEIRTSGTDFVERVRALDVSNELLDDGLAELEAVIAGCADLATDRFVVEADLRIARGLDYYTGTVFETRMAGYESIGSICSGGRYDSLATDGRVTYPGTGISLGISRMLVPLLTRGRLAGSRAVPSAVLVALPDDESRARCDEIAQALRARASRPRCRRTRRSTAGKFASRNAAASRMYGSRARRGSPTRSRTSEAARRWSPIRPVGCRRPTICARRS